MLAKRPMANKSTMTDLVSEMQRHHEKIHPTNWSLFNETLDEAKVGEYHDYKNKKYACGKVEVVGRLKLLGLNDLANRVIAGEFDENADEDDKAEMRKTLPESMWKAFGLVPK